MTTFPVFVKYMSCIHAIRLYKMIPVLIVANFVGNWAEKRVDLRMSKFHNKSALFGGRDLAPGERVW